MTRTIVPGLVALLLGAPPLPAHADDALAVELVPKAQKGQGQPELVVRARTTLTKVVLDVRRASDGKRVKRGAGPVLGGRAHSFQLPMKGVGADRFKGTLQVVLGDGQTGSMPIDVQATLLAPLEVKVKAEDLDLAANTVRFAASRPLARAQATLMSDDGTLMGTTEVELSAAGADGGYRLEFDCAKGTILRITLQAWDADGFFGGVDLFPWRVDIPHEEVNFRSGQHVIDAAEVPKLEASFGHLRAAIAKYGKLADIRLFIAGHTDTVGDLASNRALSQRRARAIAAWFIRRGIKIHVLYAGFGEQMLLVDTPDETDRAENRRAEYIVAVQEPHFAGREVTWQRAK